MRIRALRITVLSLLWVVGLLVIGGAGLYWRLSQGPISLAFLGTRIEDAINSKLAGMRISMGEAELELDMESRTPTVRARNLILKSVDGEILASSPKAGVTLETSRILAGVLSVSSLELIGPEINMRRNLDGSLELGIQSVIDDGGQEIVIDPEALDDPSDGKSDSEAQIARGKPAASAISGSRLLSFLDAGGDAGALSALSEVRISRAKLTFFDEANDSTWIAPTAELAFRRVSSGFVVAARAQIDSSGEPWNVEASATYRRDERNYTANLAIANLVPARVSDRIFALSQFARVDIPFSGNFEADLTEDGQMTRASGQLFASAGKLNLPEYLAESILVDEGSVRLSYAGAGKPFEINEASILMGGTRADLKGAVTPRYAEDGRLAAIAIDLTANNVSLDTQGTVRDPVFVDRVEFSGEAAVEDPRVDIKDLVVMAGNTGVRLRGVITGGELSPGINIAGRLREVSAPLLKKLWPPIVAPRSRNWINENIKSGRITEGAFQMNFAPDDLATAQRTKVLQPGSVDMTFSMENVTSSYFKTLPLLEGASGSARLKDNDFTLTIDKGTVSLASGNKVELVSGKFVASELLAVAVPGSFDFDVKGSVAALFEYATAPELRVAVGDITEFPKIGGTARAKVSLRLPLMKNVPREKVKFTTEVKLENAAMAAVMPGIDLTDGEFSIDLGAEAITVKGPAKLNGIKSNVVWQRPRGSLASRSEIETVVDEKLRAKLNIKLDDYMTGDVPVKLIIEQAADKTRNIEVEADLSGVDMRVVAASWSRPATKGTKASFRIVDRGKDGRLIEDLKIDGKNLRVRGSVALKAGGGLASMDLDEIRIGTPLTFAARLKPGSDVMEMSMTGPSFDARPYIKSMISPAKGTPAPQKLSGPKIVVRAQVDEVTAFRGEVVRDVSATFESQGGQIQSALIEGKFASGLPITVRLEPVENGRELRIASVDGGAAIRSSNFYSKIAGGRMNFYALMANSPGSPIRNGQLIIEDFMVRNEAALAELDKRGKPQKSGPRSEGIRFRRLSLPFTTDQKFVRFGKTVLRGPEICAFLRQGVIRKADGAIDIDGTMIPACEINRVTNDIPLIGDILTGGGEGVFGMTFAMAGTISEPDIRVNPLSALAPGFIRKIFEFR